MPVPDYRGARGSNAGDDFHELWALRQSLVLLDPDSGLTEVAVEGLRAEDESGAPRDTWDGVDCTLYYGRAHDDHLDRIVIEQFKYSGANPDDPWTVSRLTHATNKNKDNSVVGKLAKAFTRLRLKFPDLFAIGALRVCLVSNQPVDARVMAALSAFAPDRDSAYGRRHQADRAALLEASELSEDDFVAFASAFEFNCGHGSRLAIEERVLISISEWTEDDARTSLNFLLRYIQQAMGPEGKGKPITRESILSWFGFSYPALFPCPAFVKKVDRLIPRAESKAIVHAMESGAQRVCVHGEAGCGKTTALQELETLLPSGSVVIVFDCYGSGRYLDSDAYRHLPKDAFLQLSNELAGRLRIPLLVSQGADARVFKRRLEKAATAIASTARDALLVVAVDAADNSITAATTRSPRETSFVHEFIGLGDLPTNVRLIVTARTGRLPSLQLPDNFVQIPMKGFARDETAVHVREIWNEAPGTWVDDFHHLSRGNPRVQQYALRYAGARPEEALDYLRPSGKALDQIFRERLIEARRKVGHDQDLEVFCAGLIALERPIPLAHLSAVTDLNPAHLRDLCTDLTPGVRLTGDTIGLADEDFEDFLRTEGESQINIVRARIADRFLSCHASDAYAATHIASALLAAHRGREIIDLINAEKEPVAIGDPVLRREAQLGRLRIAMKVCRETGNNVDAMLTLLIGAEALKTDAAIRRMLLENPDLAASFARDTSSRLILRDPGEIENHGPLLFQVMAVDAQRGDAISVREGSRQVRAWMQRRTACFEEQKKRHANAQPHGWDINDRDIAAETEAVLRVAGPQQAVDYLRRWRPKSVVLRVASILSRKLIASGEASLVERCIAEARIRSPWDLFLHTPLALAGREVDVQRLEASLARLRRRGWIRLNRLRDAWDDDHASVDYMDTILTACELVVAHGGNRSAAASVLEVFADPEHRRRDRIFTSQVFLIDLTLRAHALLEALAGRQFSLATYWIDPPAPAENLSSKELGRHERLERDKREELQNFVGPLIDLYRARAGALVGSIQAAEVDAALRDAIGAYRSHEYRLSRNPSVWAIQRRLALSIARLMVVPGLSRALLLEKATAVLNAPSPLNSAGTSVLESFALDGALHQQILAAALARVEAVLNLKASAEDKLTVLVDVARLLVPISPGDARSVFNHAIEVAGKLDVETMHEIALVAPLTQRSAASLASEEKRVVARNLAIVVADAGIRLSGQEGFPWESASSALATLDIGLALAATGRWDDSNVVDRGTCLPSILETTVARRDLSPPQACALLALLDHVDTGALAQIADAAALQKDNLDTRAVAEEIAREELLRFGRGTRPEVSHKLSMLPGSGGPGFWLDRLVRTTEFLQHAQPERPSSTQVGWRVQHRDQGEKGKVDPFNTIHWAATQFTAAKDIAEVAERILALAQEADVPLWVSEILERIRSTVALRDRAAHLEALSRCESEKVSPYELAEAIAKGVDEWQAFPSVTDWIRNNLRRILGEQLPGFSRYLAAGQSPLPRMLETCSVPDHEICGALLEAMERNVNSLGAATVCALVGLVGRYCTPNEAGQVLARHAERLVQRIPPAERDEWQLDDVPIEPTRAVARLLYAFMSDVDVRVRWRAAHALRSLARLGDVATLTEVVELFSLTVERTYRDPNAPFYWLAARLWLTMALDRIADETPAAMKDHSPKLLKIASDDSFPHVLLREFAKSAVRKLVECGALALKPSERGILKRANVSRVRRRHGRKPYDVDFGHYPHQRLEQRRFHFNTMDTLRYWYSPAVRIFADVDRERFLDAAERWIVDRWGVHDNPWQWDAQPRQSRLSDSYALDHGHGSLPILERFNTYLEWHAMWCAVGEFMQTHALRRSGDDDYYTFERWLGGEGLSTPPFWLADLRGPKPLEERMWFAPRSDVGEWVEKITDEDFLVELGLHGAEGPVVVGAHHDTRSRGFRLSARVETALVSPDTAASILRALQTVDDSWAYRIPPAGDELEINSPPYKLVGWLLRERGDLGIDERDPFRYEVDRIECSPSDKTMASLDLRLHHQSCSSWASRRSGEKVFVYEAWGDNRGDEREHTLRYDEKVRSSGWRLRIDREALHQFLTKVNLDLIVEIEITRGNSAYDHWRDDEEKGKEAKFDRVIVLRKDGTIEAAEGRIGTWAASGAGTGAGGRRRHSGPLDGPSRCRADPQSREGQNPG